jgi:TusA-related sulfurtransferase
MASAIPAPDHTFDGGDMDCGSGLILLIRENMARVPAGGILEIRSEEPTVVVELPPWCRMTGHEYVSAEESAPGRWRHFVRRGADTAGEAAALEKDKRDARNYEWRVRARLSGNQEATIFARNFSWKLGQPASFEEKDDHPSAMEAMLAALTAELLNGFATACRQNGFDIDDLEATAKAKLHNVLAHLGMEQGDPSLASADITVFITSPAAGAELRSLFTTVLSRAPLYQTLSKVAAVAARLVIL